LRNVLPPTYLAIAIVVILIIHFILPLSHIAGMPWRLFGLVPLVLGGILNLAADSSFKRNNTTVKPFRKSSVLVTGGVFRISRHPMYLGFVLILWGIALLLGSLSPYLIVIAFSVFLELMYIREEERMLEQQFQDEWRQYRRKVRRWL